MLSRRRIGEHIRSSTQCVDVHVGVSCMRLRVRSDLLPVTINRLFNGGLHGGLRHYPIDTVRLAVASLASYFEGWAYRNITATNLVSMIAGMRHSEPPRLHEADNFPQANCINFRCGQGVIGFSSLLPSFGATRAWTCSIFRMQPLLKKEQERRRLSTRVKWLKRFVVGHGHVSPHGETGAR